MNKRLKKILIFIILFLAVFVVTKFALAQNAGPDTGMQYAAEIGLSADDPRIVVARIIRIFMGFLGIIAVGLILYAGWLWMTAGGNDERIGTAKKLLIGAVIGLIIVLSAFTIASFLLSQFLDATTGTSNTGGGGGVPGGGTTPGGGGIGLIACDRNPFTAKCEADVSRCLQNQYCGDDCYCHDQGGWGAKCDGVATSTTCEPNDDMCLSFLKCMGDQGCRCLGAPVIKWIDPIDANQVPNGAPGNFITIGGEYFGTTTGKVYFSDAKGEPTVLAPFPDTVNPKCNKNWKDKQIIVIVPAGARLGPIKVVRYDGEIDTTNDSRGPNIKDFEVNSIKRPGVCLLDPDKGLFQAKFSVEGTGFYGTHRNVFFGSHVSSTSADNVNGWANNQVKASIPNIKPGDDPVFVTIDGVDSNSLIMNILYDLSSNPSIDYIDPPNGPVGQYITIYGKNFQSYKSNISLVQFYNPTTRATSSADGLDMAKECRDNWWHDTYITVKVPKVDQLGKAYIVRVTNADGRISAPAPENFTVKTGDAGPGLCLLEPHNSPVGYPVSAYGDKFGAIKANGKTVFYNNVNGVFDTSTSWANQKVVSKVPSGAVTGPFVVVDTKDIKSNSLPFMVGKCSDSKKDCLSGEVCCQSGTYWDGICRKLGSGETEEITCNKGKPDLGAYGWTFSTTPPQPEVCSGYTTAKSCSDASMCPNSPGLCQTNSSVVVGNGCDNSICNLNYKECANSACAYDSILNRCKINNSSCNATSSSIISGQVAECRLVNGQAVWQYNPRGGSCSLVNSFLDTNGWCSAGSILSPQKCSLCPGGFDCFNGQCAAANQMCPQNSTCKNGKCIANTPTCECCCRVGKDAQDCCAGLTCTPGNCGSGTNDYGLCTGCRVDLDGDSAISSNEQTASDAACNCVPGKKNRHCDLLDPQYPKGVCRDKTTETPVVATSTGPQVVSTEPADNEINVCRNAVISAAFDRKMSASSFLGNILVVGDYGTLACPKGTDYLAKDSEPKTKIALFFEKINNIIKKFLNPFLHNANAYSPPQPSHNYCKISGKITTFTNASTTVEFKPSNILDSAQTYYVIIKGDPDKTDSDSEGVLDINNIGMNIESASTSSKKFNNIEYKNSYIWQFTTMSDQGDKKGICVIDKVVITPSSYLFNTAANSLIEPDDSILSSGFDTVYDKDKLFKADAISKNKQKITPVNGYSWTWDWSIDNNKIVDFVTGVKDLDGNQTLVEAKAGVVEGKTYVNADVNISEDIFKTGITKIRGTASAWVFICENPWPVVTNGIWAPWRDNPTNCTASLLENSCSDTGFELYYCRDKDNVGTADDLPAILSSETIIRGLSTTQNLLKEFYFFREFSMDTPSLAGFSVIDAGTGGVVSASWPAIQGVAGYKLYYGLRSRSYNYYVDATSTAKTISGLNNKTKYYFAYTSYNDKMVESSYSDEIAVIPSDSIPPRAPVGITATSSGSQIDVSWIANTDDAVGYKVQYGTYTGVYGKSSSLLKTTKYKITGLSVGQDYYIVVNAVDINKNQSTSTEIKIGTPPATPKNVKSVSGNNQITFSWSANTDNATGYKIYYSQQRGVYDKSTPIIQGTSYAVSDLLAGKTYYFKIVAINNYNHESVANEIVVSTNL